MPGWPGANRLQNHIGDQARRGGVHPVRHPRLQDAHALQRAQLEAQAARGMGLLARGEAQGLFRGIKQDRLLQHQIAGIELRIVDVGFGRLYRNWPDRSIQENGLAVNRTLL